MAAGNQLDLTTMANRVIDRALIPGRQREPRVAAQLAQAERIDVTTPHGHVAAWRVGTGPAALLVHGFRDSARVWGPLMAGLTARGRAFAALDTPGHGFSEGERCGPAERNPDPSVGDATDVAQQRWRRIAAELGFDPTIGDHALEVYYSSLSCTRARWDLSDALANLNAHVLVVASVDDERFDVDAARSFCEPMPNVEFVTLTGLDHRASARDATVVDAIATFLDHR
jgi:pimeloyl-ACP methyl ester carboxylesterase